MFEFSVRKDMKKIASPMKSMLHRKRGSGTREGSGTFMLTLIVNELKISV